MKEEIQSNLSFREAFERIDSDAFVTVSCLGFKTYRLMVRGLGILDVEAGYNRETEAWEVKPLSSTVQSQSIEERMIAAFRSQEGMN